MQAVIILLFCLFVLSGCSRVETASNENVRIIPTTVVSVSPTVETNSPLKSVKPNIKLDSTQKKYLNESLPPQAREVLEKAERFEILAEVLGENDPDSMGFYPNRIAEITDENTKKEILEKFYYDASGGPYPSACYVPHHGIRAKSKGKTVEIEICFQCHMFRVESSFGKFDGGIVRENHRSEGALNSIIQNQSVELK